MGTAKNEAATWVPITQLVPWEKNPRINDHAVDAIAKSITEFGWADVIVARKADNMVISGHTRLKAATKLGQTVVPVRFIDVDRDKAEKLAIAANKLGELSSWDDDKLSQVLMELSQGIDQLQSAFDFSTLGFSAQEFDALVAPEKQWKDENNKVDGANINPYHPDNETFVVKIDGVKALDKAQLLEHVQATLDALGGSYTAKAY